MEAEIREDWITINQTFSSRLISGFGPARQLQATQKARGLAGHFGSHAARLTWHCDGYSHLFLWRAGQSRP
jgi:hypothetical protein